MFRKIHSTHLPWRPKRAGTRGNKIELSKFELNKFNDSLIGHEFGGMSRVIVVRKTDQRIFASAKNGEEPKYETVTKETYVTYRGNKTERKFTSVETKDVTGKIPIESLKPSPRRTPLQRIPSAHQASRLKNNDESTFQSECLAAHNEYRSKHGVPPLKLSKRICQVSKDWATRIAVRGTVEHSKNNEYGENIFCISSSNPNFTIDGRAPVDSWYSEIEQHIFGCEPSNMGTGHFTQVVWKETKELGVACVKGKNGKIFVVANYYPPGNYIGCYTENVPPVGGYVAVDSLSSSMKGLSTSTSSGAEKEAAFELECLEAHNAYRSQHGALPLTLNKKLCKDAKDWAKTLALKGVMQHKPNIPYGENIFASWSSNPNHVCTGKEPVDKWYEEIHLHNFSREPTDLRSGHFTQVIWKGSKELGVGFAKSKNGQIFVVARYNPPGNYVGNFCRNVLPKGTPVAQSPVGEEGIEDEETFVQQALKIHNEYRRKHGVPDLKLNQEMCDYAKEWAQFIAKEGKMMHRTDGKYGENIFMMWSSDPSAVPSAKDVCKKWYDEINDYNFTMESRTKELKAGHFTQMIWKESSEFGIAMAKGKNGKKYVVANYNPKGNFIGQFINNVPRPVK